VVTKHIGEERTDSCNQLADETIRPWKLSGNRITGGGTGGGVLNFLSEVNALDHCVAQASRS